MKITPTTTLGELELRLRSFGACLFVQPQTDGRYYALVNDDEISGEAYGGTLDEAIDAAFTTYQQNKFGPKPRKDDLS